MSRPDDEAFSWDGDDDPTLTPGPHANKRDEQEGSASSGGAPDVPLVEPEAPEDTADPDLVVASREEAPEDAPPRRMGDVALVAISAIAGVYLLWTIGWIVTVMRMRDVMVGAPDPMFLASAALAILAPVIWFGAAWFLTRHHRTWIRIAALIGGVVVLVPWPFVMLGVIGR